MIMTDQQIILQSLKIAIQFLGPTETKELEAYFDEQMTQCMHLAMKEGVDVVELRQKHNLYQQLKKLL